MNFNLKELPSQFKWTKTSFVHLPYFLPSKRHHCLTIINVHFLHCIIETKGNNLLCFLFEFFIIQMNGLYGNSWNWWPAYCLTCLSLFLKKKKWWKIDKFKFETFSICLITISGAGPLACTSCPAHYMLDGGLCMECLGSQFYDPMTQTCKTCHESCRSCSGPGQYSCVACAFPLHLDRLNNQCVPCCPTGALPDDQSCCHCDKDTGIYERRIHLQIFSTNET